jgi:predicted ATP-dependent endonuclease of OLD family
MKFTKFEIKEYRAIDSIEVNLNHQIMPIIGVNESGKTSILQAILCFDKDQDKLNKGYHLQYENRYAGIRKQNCSITASIFLDDSEFDKLYKSLHVKSDNEIFDILNNFKKNKKPIAISRILSSSQKQYKLISPEIEDNTIKDKIVKHIIKNQPFILYFDDFTDRVPPEVAFNPDYKATGKITGRKDVEWQFIIEEIFNRSGADGFDENHSSEKLLQTFMKIENKDKRDDVLSDIKDVLETEIITEWKEMKKKGLNRLADDADDLELSIKYDDSNYTFEFKVKDKAYKGKQRTFNINHRSKGFQWFFNYMVKLKFNPKYKDNATNSIYLLDEPGSYLHSSAQQELLKNLYKVSETNNLIYCTHSHYLLDPNIIKLGSIRIAEKQQANISLTNYGDFKGKNENGALSPVYQALQLNISNDFIGKIAIFEGITDFYFFSIIQQNSGYLSKEIKLIPGQGSGNSTTMVSFSLSFSDDFIVVFDNDKGWSNGIKKYKKVFGENIISKFHKYSDKEDFKLENLISDKDSKYLLEKTKSNDLKKSFGLFFYDKKELHEEFVKNLSKETVNRCKSTFDKLNSL